MTTVENFKSKYPTVVPLLVILGVGLALRLAIFVNTADTELRIVDEQHYHRIATNLIEGHGFAKAPGEPTSMRPPLYPFLVRVLWGASGDDARSLQLVRLFQIFLSLANVVLVYRLGLLVYDQRVASIAAGLLCFYPSLVGFNYLLLTEVLFTFLITASAYCYARLVPAGRLRWAFVTGLVLGLAALTRSIAWPFAVMLCPFLLLGLKGQLIRRVSAVAVLVLGFAIVVSPWSIRNTKLQGEFALVDTMGGFNLYMGNYEFTPLNRAWAAIGIRGDKSWSAQLFGDSTLPLALTDGEKEKVARKEAVEFIKQNPLLTLHRSLVKFLNFWGLERSLIAGWKRGNYEPPGWFIGIASILIVVSFPFVLVLGTIALFASKQPDWRNRAYFVLLACVLSGIHSLIFGHPRYHLPLIPLLCLFAALGIEQWRQLGSSFFLRTRVLLPVGILFFVFLGWARDVLIVDSTRIRDLLSVLS